MKTRIALFFLVIFTVSASYLLFDFQETSNEENRTLKTNIEFKNGKKSEIMTGAFQSQLEELLSDQILKRSSQVKLQSRLTNAFGIHNQFAEGLYKYNDKIILRMNVYLRTSIMKKLYSQEYYDQVESITEEVEAYGADFSIYFVDLERYYSNISFEEASLIGAQEKNDNFYDANTILNNDQYAFIAGDHHLTMESQYKMFAKVMENWKHSDYVLPFDTYYDTSQSKAVTGTREQKSKEKFQITGIEYAPRYDTNMFLYENGREFEVEEVYCWDTSIKTSYNSLLSPGYGGPSSDPDGKKRRVKTKTGKFYIENNKAPLKENILIIGNSQILGISPFFYKTFQQVHTFDVRYQQIDVKNYMQENNISHLIYYGGNPFGMFDVWF